MVDEHESTTDVIVEPAPEAKPKRRRATKKAAAPTDVEGYAAAPSSAAGEASAEVVTATDEAEAESAPKARATAKRATRKPAKRAKAVPISASSRHWSCTSPARSKYSSSDFAQAVGKSITGRPTRARKPWRL